MAFVGLVLLWQVAVLFVWKRRSPSAEVVSRVALVLAPTGLLLVLPPAVSNSSIFLLSYGSVTALFSPLGAPVFRSRRADTW